MFSYKIQRLFFIWKRCSVKIIKYKQKILILFYKYLHFKAISIVCSNFNNSLYFGNYKLLISKISFWFSIQIIEIIFYKQNWGTFEKKINFLLEYFIFTLDDKINIFQFENLGIHQMNKRNLITLLIKTTFNSFICIIIKK